MPKNKFFMFSNGENQETTELRINGVIGTTWWDDVIEQDFIKRLDSIESNKIIVRVNSAGGEVFAGFSIYNNLKAHKAKIEVVIEGLAGSVASVIAMAGDEIKMSKTAGIMIHNPWTSGARGEAKDLRSKAEALEKMKDMAIEAYLSKANITREEISEMMDNTSYLTATEALEKGFITEIIDDGTGILIEEGDILNTGLEKYHMSIFKDFPKEKFVNEIKNKISKKNEEVQMSITKKDIQQNHPEIYREILLEGEASERARLEEIDNLPIAKGAENIVLEAKYKNFLRAGDVAVQILNHNASVGKGILENLKTDLEENGNVSETAAETQKTNDKLMIDEAISIMMGGNK